MAQVAELVAHRLVGDAQSGPWMARARDSVVDDWMERLRIPDQPMCGVKPIQCPHDPVPLQLEATRWQGA